MATGALTRQFLCSTRIVPAHFRSLCVLQRTLQFNPLFAIAARAASTATAKKTASKTTGSKPGPKSKTTAKKPASKPKKATATGKKTTKATTKTAAKKPAAKKPAAKKPAVKKPAKKAAKKAAPKKKKKPVLTLEQKHNKLLKKLREAALDPPSRGHTNGYIMWFKEQPQLKATEGTGEMWKSLPQETKDRYIEKAKQSAPAHNKAFGEWVASKPVSEIYKANLARRRLRKLGAKRGITLFVDSRIPKRPLQPFILYLRDQYRTGREFEKDETGKITVINNNKILRKEFSELPLAEKKKYEDRSIEDRKRYSAEMERLK
jgi:hypothetical protein